MTSHETGSTATPGAPPAAPPPRTLEMASRKGTSVAT